MKTTLALALAAVTLTGCAAPESTSTASSARQAEGEHLELGAFSVSLAVKDLEASRVFYQRLGFQQVLGDATQNWLILRNGTTTIGLFQGMFDKNIMTFNPGWNRSAETLDDFLDVREIQKRLKNRGIALIIEADESTTGPASLVIQDPDGNQILIDQHVARPTE